MLNNCLLQEPAKHLQGEAGDQTRLEGFQRGDDQDQEYDQNNALLIMKTELKIILMIVRTRRSSSEKF